MTRKEEIKQAAHLYSPNNWHNTADTFEYGAEWADEHPKEGLVDINKAIEYLANYLLCTGYNLQTKAQFIHNFRIAMEK